MQDATCESGTYEVVGCECNRLLQRPSKAMTLFGFVVLIGFLCFITIFCSTVGAGMLGKRAISGIPLEYVMLQQMLAAAGLFIGFGLAGGISVLLADCNVKHAYRYSIRNREGRADLIVGKQDLVHAGLLSSMAIGVPAMGIAFAFEQFIVVVSLAAALCIVFGQVVMTLVAAIVVHQVGRFGIHSITKFNDGLIRINLGCRYYREAQGSFVVEDAPYIKVSIESCPGSNDQVNILVTNEKQMSGLGRVWYVPICLAPSFAETMKSWIETSLSNDSATPYRTEGL